MPENTETTDPRVINSVDTVPDWDLWNRERSAPIRKIVLGASPGSSGAKALRMEALPANFARRFPALTHLYLWGIEGLGQIPELPKGLRCLDVRGCGNLETIPVLPDTLENLDLGACPRIRSIPGGPLPNLKWVYLNGCTSLQSFGPLRLSLGDIKRLELNGCNFDDLPSFLCGEAKENVVDKVRSHFQALAGQGAVSLPECKVVILGNGGVGKTSLVRALKRLAHREAQESTDGIRLWSWDADGFVPFPESSPETVQLNVWDFGGQDLYHNTHRLFLESRAIFVIVWRQPRIDGAPFRPEFPDDPVRPLNYWLDQVYGMNPNAHVIVVRTGMDEDTVHPPEDWKTGVRTEYHRLPSFEVSARVRTQGQWPNLLQALRTAVLGELRGAEAVKLGSGRRAVREALRTWQPSTPDADTPAPESARPLMRVHEFIALVREIYSREKLPPASESEALLLLDYLHHSGSVYCPKAWRDNSVLHGAFPIIVDQRWAIDGIYELFRPGEVRDQLVACHGRVTADYLEQEIWGGLRDAQGSLRFDATAQWVFTRFMASCGLLVILDRGEDAGAAVEVLIPELLPKFDPLVRMLAADPLVAVVKGAENGRRFMLRDRSLGQGFGCLLVGKLAQLFGKVPLYRYGGIGRVQVGDELRAGRGQEEVVVRVEWYRERADAYQGDLVVAICGNEIADADALGFLLPELRSIPGFPTDARFETAAGALPAALQTRLNYLVAPRRSEADLEAHREPSRALPRLGVVGVSMAGEDSRNPGIERLPRALEKRLNQIEGRCFDVISYRSDQERTSVSQLIGDLVRSDLILAFVGQKYLGSAYCLVELLETARRLQPGNTFENPTRWPEFLWSLPFKDADSLLDRGEGATSGASQVWKEKWVSASADHWSKVIKEFRGRPNAVKNAPAKYPFHAWMEFAEAGEEGLGLVLAAVSQARRPWNPGNPPCDLTEKQLEDWAAKQVEELAVTVEQRIRELVKGLSRKERQDRAEAACRKYWKAGRPDRAAEAFDHWLNAQEDPAATRVSIRDKTISLTVPDLQPIRDFYLERQGTGG